MPTGAIKGLGLGGGLIVGKSTEGTVVAAHRIGLTVGDGFTKSQKTMSFGIDHFQDFSQTQAFLNICKTARYGVWDFGGTVADYDTLAASETQDAKGYFTTLDAGLDATSYGMLWAWNDLDKTFLAGDYTFTCQGADTPRVFGTGITQNSVAAITGGWEVRFTMDGATAANFFILFDGFTEADYPRDFVCVRDIYRTLYDAGEEFHPQFLSDVAQARELRFMDAMDTNGNLATTWATYPKDDWVTYAIRCPIEPMIRLCNTLGCDMWLNIPTKAAWVTDGTVDTAFATSLATLVKANLNPDLKFICEYSNEVWNTSFAANAEMVTQATAAGWSNTAAVGYCAKINVLQAKAMTAVYGAEAAARFEWVYASGAAQFNSWSPDMADASTWMAEEAGSWEHPNTYSQTFTIATYDSSRFASEGTEMADLATFLNTGSPTEQQANTYIDGRISALGYVATSKGWWLGSYNVFAAEGITKMKGYEGGRHVLHTIVAGQGLSAPDLALVVDALGAYTRSQESADVEADKWDYWKTISYGPYMIFLSHELNSVSGAFYLYEGIGATNPRSDYVTNRSNTEKPWWFDDRDIDLTLLS